jgi:heme/copper-type cytochrome/quinol oxidase subunit 2
VEFPDASSSFWADAGREAKGGAMYEWMDGWDWVWMTFMMGFWVVVFGAVLYAVLRLANRPPTHPKSR